MMTRRQNPARQWPRSNTDGLGILAVVLIAGGVLVLFHVAVLLASGLAGGARPTMSQTVGAVIDSWKNPAAGFDPAAKVTGWAYFWFVFVLAMIVAGVALVRWVFSGSKTKTDQGAVHQAKYVDVKGALSREAALSRARGGLENTMLDTDMDKVTTKKVRDFIKGLPDDYLISFLGTRERKSLYGQSEDSTLVVAPPRTGKTMFMAVAKVIDAPGACLATSTRADLLQLTAGPRSMKGRVHAFDLDGISGWPDVVKWNPVLGCEDIEVAKRRGDAWAGAQPIGDDTKNGGFFNSKAGHVLSRLLFTAAIGGKTMREVVEWSNNLASEKPLKILEQNRTLPGAEAALSYLESLKTSRAGESVDSVQLTLSNLLEPLALPRVMDQLTCAPHEAFDIRAFLDSTDTVILMADEETGAGTSPIVSMFAGEVMAEARKLSQTKPGARFWPPFRMVLDEAPSLAAFPEMAKYMADSGGRGIELSVFAQTFSQLRSRWGKEDAETIQGAATIKYYFPGLGIIPEVKDLSELIGHYDKRSTSHTRQSRGGVSVSESSREQLIMTPKQINEIPDGTAIMRYRNRAPIHINLKPWWQRKDAAEIRRRKGETQRACGIKSHEVPELPNMQVEGGRR